MTLQIGDKAVVIPLRDGGRVTVRSGTISVGDKAVLIPGANGQIYAVRPASPQVGDKVIVYPLRNGGHVCLASADDDGGGSSPSVMPPGNFDAVRTGPSTADLKWLPGEGNTAVRIVRRDDRYPTHINDGTVAYEGAGDETVDTGLDYRKTYYYCIWGKAGSKYSNGYLVGRIGPWRLIRGTVCVIGAYIGDPIWNIKVWWNGEVVLSQSIPQTPRQSSCIKPGMAFAFCPEPGLSDEELIRQNLVVWSSGEYVGTYSADSENCNIESLGGRRYDVGFDNNPHEGDLLWDDPALLVTLSG